MADTRFTTIVNDADDLLSVIDVDVLGDVETLLMFLFARPIAVAEAWDGHAEEAALEVVVQGNDTAVGITFDFPLTMIELARSCASSVDELGPYSKEGFAMNDAEGILAMNDAELITALQQALGQVRLFNMMDDGE